MYHMYSKFRWDRVQWMGSQTNQQSTDRPSCIGSFLPFLSLSLSLFFHPSVSPFFISNASCSSTSLKEKKQGNESYFWTSANGSMHKVLAGRGRSGGRVHSRNHWCISLEQRWYLNIHIYNIRKNPAPLRYSDDTNMSPARSSSFVEEACVSK